MEKELTLHEDYGLNVTIPVCIFCEEAKNELVMLGAAYKDEAPMHMIIDEEPCEACKEKLDGNEWKHFIGDCGHKGFIKIKALKKILEKEKYKSLKNHPVFRIDKCFHCMGVIE